jgi:EAL domain-containing protein (putative c-di-GMP-specific phosphodiesterase class I)
VALVKAVLAMAEALGCEMIAEGVETTEQLHILREMGCSYAQGWLIGRPLPLQDVLEG